MKRAKNIEGRLNKLITEAEEEKPFVAKERHFRITNPSSSHQVHLTAQGIGKKYGERPAIHDCHLRVERGERLAVIGPNGAGKTTLLSILAGELLPDDGELWIPPSLSIGYYRQDTDHLDPHKNPLMLLTDGERCQENRVRTFLGCLGLAPEAHLQPIGKLSVGQRCKVQLARILMGQHHILIFDEPTNHLEIGARENLEKALLEFQGSLIFASHDRRFCEMLATKVFCLG